MRKYRILVRGNSGDLHWYKVQYKSFGIWFNFKDFVELSSKEFAEEFILEEQRREYTWRIVK